MPESASTDSLMARPVSPITDDDHDLSTTFLNGSGGLTLQPLGSSSSETSLSLRARSYSAEEQDIEDLPENPVQHAKGLRNLISDWNLELLALISSAVSLSALIILLARQDGQPLSTWTLPLSLNKVVSLLLVIIKTPLAFVVGTCLGQGKWAWFFKRQGPRSAFVAIEEAGRGPLGSLTLMWMWKLKFRHWVCFGAGITVALLAIDPFLQGLVQYVGKMSSTAESGASMMRSHGLDVGEWYAELPYTLQYHGQSVRLRCYQGIHQAAILFSGWVVMESRGIELETFKSEPLEILLNGFDAKSRDYLMVTRKAGQNVDGKMIQLEKAVEGPELRLKDE
ncbi:hypothetical protein NCS57_00855200 [Fusarium keratoplasticum]|uniref:Uncharacterized protein n=1 Tax=Fusarium keratoplasticum TaxID=1328300 RepID=A0ACC0QU58_9HYPO|nr:hypothetical protein NCS57_00855200 [Fusarium keratoplasticum]KAI8666307.1 hypothetical protein NCS57_00855200 [Fusarium keratoplasticum]